MVQMDWNGHLKVEWLFISIQIYDVWRTWYYFKYYIFCKDIIGLIN